MHFELFGLFVFVFGAIALMFYKLKPIPLFFSGVGLTIYGAMLGIDLKSQGVALENSIVIGLGEIFLIFIAIVGGAMVSTAFNELRENHKVKQNLKS